MAFTKFFEGTMGVLTALILVFVVMPAVLTFAACGGLLLLGAMADSEPRPIPSAKVDAERNAGEDAERAEEIRKIQEGLPRMRVGD